MLVLLQQQSSTNSTSFRASKQPAWSEAISHVCESLESGATPASRDYFGRAVLLPSGSNRLWTLFQVKQLQLYGVEGKGSKGGIAPYAPYVPLAPTASQRKRTYAELADESEAQAQALGQAQEVTPIDSHPDVDSVRFGAPLVLLTHNACLNTFDKHAAAGFKRPWVTIVENGRAKTLHFENAHDMRAAWAYAIRTLADEHGVLMVSALQLKFPLRLELAQHLRQCGKLGELLLDELDLSDFLQDRLECGPWYSQYVNQFMLGDRLDASARPRAIAQVLTGYPMSMLAMLLFVRLSGTPSTASSDCARLVVPRNDLQEFAAVLRLQHSAVFRRMVDQLTVVRELCTLIGDLQRHYAMPETDIAAYSRRFLLDSTHAVRFERHIRHPMNVSSDSPASNEAAEMLNLCVTARQRIRSYYRSQNLTFSLPRLYTRLGSCSGPAIQLVRVDLCTLLQWFSEVKQWAVCAHLVLTGSVHFAFRAFPASRQFSIFKTLARVEATLGENCIDRWIVAPSPIHSGECLLIGTDHFWVRFAAQQSQIYLSASRLPGLQRSRHADMFQIVRALMCGDDYTVCNVFCNVLIGYMSCTAGAAVPFSVVRGRCDYYRYLPHLLQKLFGSTDMLVDEFHDSALYVPRDEILINRTDKSWVGLPLRWNTVHVVRGHPHRPHFYYALMGFLSVHRTRFVHIRLFREVYNELISRGVFLNRGRLGHLRKLAPWPEDSADAMFYNHIDNWMCERMSKADCNREAWVPLLDDDIVKYASPLHESDAHLSIAECWYQLCCDEAALSHETRLRMFMCITIDGIIEFPASHHHMLTTDCQYPLEWVRSMLDSGMFGTCQETMLNDDDETRIRCMHDYFLNRCLQQESAYNDSLWHPRNLRVWPVYNRSSLEMVITLTCMLRDGVIHDVPAPYERDTCPFGTLEVSIADPKVHARERLSSEDTRLAALSGPKFSRFTVMTSHRTKQQLTWARKFSVRFMEELRRLIEVSSTESPCAMTYKTAQTLPERLGSQTIVLLSDDMMQYTTHWDSPANAPDTTLMTEASLFTHFQRNDMRRRMLECLDPQERRYYDEALPRASSHEAPDDEEDAPHDLLDDTSALASLSSYRSLWFFYSLWESKVNDRVQYSLRTALLHAMSVEDLACCSLVCRRWYLDIEPLLKRCAKVYKTCI